MSEYLKKAEYIKSLSIQEVAEILEEIDRAYYRKYHCNGYPMTKMRSHPRARARGYIPDHILVVEKALGHPLYPPHEVHHVDGNPTNNENSNLVVCENHEYHFLLHKRTRALKACGHANWHKCSLCQKYSPKDELYFSPGKPGSSYQKIYHPKCMRDYNRTLTLKKREVCY